MAKYPMWIRIEYMEYGVQIGYTGCISSKNQLLDVFVRLVIYKSNLCLFEINNGKQSSTVIDSLFLEVEKAREEGGNDVKQGKRPNNKQRTAIEAAGLNPVNWLVTKNLQNELHIVHRDSKNQRVISIGA